MVKFSIYLNRRVFVMSKYMGREKKIKTRTTLVGRLFPSVGGENGPERGTTIVSF